MNANETDFLIECIDDFMNGDTPHDPTSWQGACDYAESVGAMIANTLRYALQERMTERQYTEESES